MLDPQGEYRAQLAKLFTLVRRDGDAAATLRDAEQALPTDALSLAMIDTLEKVCKPVATGSAKLDAVAKANGFAMKRKLWTKVVDASDTIMLQPTSTANPTTCTMTVDHPKGQFQTLVNGMHAWASRQDPILQLRAPYAYDDQVTGMKRTTVGWEAPSVTSTTGMTGMAFTCSDESEIITRESPILTVACMILPSGRRVGSWVVSAPNAFCMKARIFSAPSTIK